MQSHRLFSESASGSSLSAKRTQKQRIGIISVRSD